MNYLQNTLFIVILCALKTITFVVKPPPLLESFRYTDQDFSPDVTNNDCGKPLILTTYIKAGEIKKAQELARVHLTDISDIESYSGFLTVNDTCNSNMFFWYFPSERKNPSDPLVIWLQGGPGGSSLFGLAEEIGPFYIKNGTKLEKRQYHWSDKRNLLFIDNPVGTGFSFTKNISQCFAHNEDDVRANLYDALLQFYELFPNLQKTELFIFGESYAGKYIPALGYSIYENNDKAKIKINLKGLGIGDGYTDPVNMLDYGSLLYNVGLINKNGKDKLNVAMNECIKSIKNKDWSLASLNVEILLNTLANLTGNIDVYNYIHTDLYSSYNKFFNRTDMKCALHAGELSFGKQEFLVYINLNEDMPKSVKHWVEILLEHYRIMFYNGQLDIIVGAALTQNFIQTLKWSGADKFQKQKQFGVKDGDDLIAFGTEFGNLCEYRIRNAGHMAPKDQPKATYFIMDNFINNKSLK